MSEDTELAAMGLVIAALSELDDEACARVIRYAAERKGVSLTVAKPAVQTSHMPVVPDTEDSASENSPKEYQTFADMYFAANPQTNGDKALVAGYWLQFIKEAEDFSGAAVNKELQHVGEPLANVTDAFNQLMAKKPKLAHQTRKSGKSQQARKLYKLTEPGKRTVQNLLKTGE